MGQIGQIGQIGLIGMIRKEWGNEKMDSTLWVLPIFYCRIFYKARRRPSVPRWKVLERWKR